MGIFKYESKEAIGKVESVDTGTVIVKVDDVVSHIALLLCAHVVEPSLVV